MILSGKEIAKQLNKSIFIEPFDEKQLNPNSYNLKLHNELLVYSQNQLDMKMPNATDKIIIPESGLLLEPNKLYLGRTKEYTKTDNYVPMLEGRSSIGRLGMFIHVTAGFGDVGFAGFWTLEIFVIQSLIIYPDVEICQLYFHSIEGNTINIIQENIKTIKAYSPVCCIKILQKMYKKIFILPIKIYQWSISPMLGQNCRHTPTCSQYTIEAIQEWGVLKGVFLVQKD